MNKQNCLIMCLALSLGLSGCSYMPAWMGGKKEDKPKLAGERIPVLPVNADLQADETLKGKPALLPPPNPNPSWPQHSGVFTSDTSNLAASGKFDKVTHARIGSGESFQHTLVTRPVVGDGMVFAMDAVGTISAHDAANVEKTAWQSKGLTEEDGPDVMGGGLAYDNGKLYAASGRGLVGAFDAKTGKELWHKSMHIPFRSAPRVSGDKLFVITIDNQTYAINTATGDLVWSQRGISETTGLMNSVSPTVSGEMVISPYSSGEIYVLSVNDGKEIWSESLSSNKHNQANSVFAGISGDPIVDGDVVLNVSSGVLAVQALANGQHVWDRAIGSINTPWVAGDSLFLLTSENTLLGFAKFDGRIRWSTQLQSFEDMEQKRRPITWKGPVMVDGNLAVVSSSGQLLLVSAMDGKITATKSIPEDVYTAPVVAGGRMYLVTQGAVLYELQ